MRSLLAKSLRWSTPRSLIVVAASGIFLLDQKYGEHRSLQTCAVCDSSNVSQDIRKGLSTKVSKSALHRNFIAEAADAASPAVVNIGELSYFFRFSSTSFPSSSFPYFSPGLISHLLMICSCCD